MVSEKVDDNKKRAGLFSALKAIFSNGEEPISDDEKKAIDVLNAESERNIKLLEASLGANGTKRKILEENLKIKGDQTIAQHRSKIQEKGKEDDEFIK